MSQRKAIAFDLGDTLVEYEGVPLNWEAHYPDALLTALLAVFLWPPLATFIPNTFLK